MVRVNYTSNQIRQTLPCILSRITWWKRRRLNLFFHCLQRSNVFLF